ncbi:Kelch repeat-containing protein [Piscinibacter terrae]|nr:kelch repeat-containing protein [Albitalea terrae]
MQHGRAAHAVVSTPSGIVALAGTGASGRPVIEVERFDGKAWTVVTRLPANGLNAPAAAALGERIYLIGGFDLTTNVPVSQVRVFDTISGNWSDGPALPAPRGGHAAAVLDGRIHVIGGGNSRSTIADHTVFDPSTQQWSELAPLPRSMGSPAAVVHGGVLYSVGGRSGPSDFGDVYRYDAANNRWVAMPSIPPRGTAGAVSYCGAIHLFGGESQATESTIAEALRLDEAKGEWTRIASMPTARNFARAVVRDGSVYVVGGSRAAGSSHESAGSAIVEAFSAPCGR